jgi:glycine dehydrogenase
MQSTLQACAEAMSMTYGLTGQKRQKFFVSSDVHPQSIALVQTRGSAIGLDIVVGDAAKVDFTGDDYCGALVQYPTTFGVVNDYAAFTERAHASKVSQCTVYKLQ